MTPGRHRGPLVAWAMLIAYASLYPFAPLRPASPDALAEFFARPRYVVGFDVGLNVVAYIPLGVLACRNFLRSDEHHRSGAIAGAVLLGAALSFAMESCQIFIPYRVATVYDVIANTAGALIGALAFADPFHSMLTRPLGELRERAVIAGAWGDAGLMLVALWLLAQLNPALPFFGAGDIGEGGAEGGGPRLLQWCAVALGTCGFGLFISALVKEGRGSLRVTLVLLSAALWLKFVGASFMLQPNFSGDWVSPARIAGLAAGIAAFVPLRRMPRAGRIYLAIVTLLAGALFSKIFGAYSALDELLRLFRWPYGQLASFATLTRLLHELWAFGAVAFLSALFLRLRRLPVQ